MICFSRPYIVFTGQGILKDEVCDFLRDYGCYGINIQLLYIPHPTESEEYLADIKNATSQFDNIDIISSGNFSTEALIMNSVAHVSIYSSCHFDSVHYLGKTYVFDALPENIMHYYAKRAPEKFVLIKSYADLIAQSGLNNAN